MEDPCGPFVLGGKQGRSVSHCIVYTPRNREFQTGVMFTSKPFRINTWTIVPSTMILNGLQEI